jgi:hypothetical protein
MEEGRKRVLGIMAAILAAQKLAHYDGGKRVPATITAIDDAIRWAEEILRRIDERCPELQHSHKFVEEKDTTEVGQARMITGDSKISR